MTVVNFEEHDLFEFFYPVLHKLRKGPKIKNLKTGPFSKLFEEFNESNKQIFIKDLIGSQLLCFFCLNFSDRYINKMKYNFKTSVKRVVNQLNKLYTI
mmetsp:Transcript_13045/g.15038  ORF Transcript_13045/g.15038 Transcript_13045/m.15038 type:complete len:98 (+) Transcript_13045:908-1201(+)